MTRAWGGVVLVAVTACLNAACGPQRPRTPQRSGQDLVVLLPNDDGTTGKVEVSNPSGRVTLDTARASTLIAVGQAPGEVTELTEAEIQRIFGPALAAQPPAPIQFTLYFQFDSEELTDDSRQMLSEVLQVVKKYPVPRVTVVGHTDTTGSAESNVELGLRRANAVRALLVDVGVEGAAIDSTSHGEAALLVPTADGVFEPKNRRVDVTVR
ncbi:MAG TPA: OmpA family protein [Vicinamibacterales bacterium]|nr:OmpA family protein [Vicinamibacterales bacterium]